MYSIVYSSHTNQNTKDPFPLQQNFPPLQIVSVSCIYVECWKDETRNNGMTEAIIWRGHDIIHWHDIGHENMEDETEDDTLNIHYFVGVETYLSRISNMWQYVTVTFPFSITRKWNMIAFHYLK